MQLGNDIVDLKVDALVHPRFRERILNETEKRLYPQLDDDAEIWRLWAAKEAAFKAHRQKKNAVSFFVPKRWIVDLTDRKVRFRDEVYHLHLEETPDYIHAIASSDDRRFECLVTSEIEEIPIDRQSVLSRDLRLRAGLGNQLIKDEGGIPRLTVGGQEIPYSLSHHGRHIAIVHAIKSDLTEP